MFLHAANSGTAFPSQQELADELSHTAEVVDHDSDTGEKTVRYEYRQVSIRSVQRWLTELKRCGLMSGILPRWFVAHPFAPPFQIWTTRKGKWSEDLGRVLEYQAPCLSSDHRYPLERRCDEITHTELAEGRIVMIYYEQSTERDVGARLMQVLGQHNAWKLPDTVDAEDREDAIVAAVKRGHKAVIVGYRRVSESINPRL
jgi:hypothetical protein